MMRTCKYCPRPTAGFVHRSCRIKMIGRGARGHPGRMGKRRKDMRFQRVNSLVSEKL